MADRVVVEEATKCKRLVAVARQGMNARRGLLAHRLQQTRTDTAETLITEAAQILLNHANRPPRQCSGYRITIRTDGKVDSHLCDHRSPISHRDRVYAAEQFSNTVSVTDPA